MKFCKDCKHFYGFNFCIAPQNGISPVDGRTKPKLATAAREYELGCSFDARYFEQKQIQPKPWWKRFWS